MGQNQQSSILSQKKKKKTMTDGSEERLIWMNTIKLEGIQQLFSIFKYRKKKWNKSCLLNNAKCFPQYVQNMSINWINKNYIKLLKRQKKRD